MFVFKQNQQLCSNGYKLSISVNHLSHGQMVKNANEQGKTV